MIETRQTESFAKWLRSIPAPAQKKIAQRIARVRNGLIGDVRSLKDGVSELRIDFGPGYRIYFTRIGNVVILLLCGGDKSSQDRDIAAAKKMAKEIRQ